MNRHLHRRVNRLCLRVQRRVGRAVRRAPTAYFRTVNGVPNRIVDVTAAGVRISADQPAPTARLRRPETYTIQWAWLRTAVTEMVQAGYVEREFLIRNAGRRSSALMGLLVTFLDEVRRVILRTRKVLLRLVTVTVYIGGAERNPDTLAAVDQAGGAHVLFSYYYLRGNPSGRGGQPPAWRRSLESYRFAWLLDSGAFSLWRKSDGQEQIDLADYAAFIRRWQVPRYLQLDVVGDWQASRALLVQMLQVGLRPIPVFHHGSPWHYLDWLTRQGFPVIALGGTVGLPEPSRRAWLREVFERYPDQLFHGLGIGSSLVLEFPFVSVDSTTYLIGKKELRDAGRPVLTDLGRSRTRRSRWETLTHNVAYSVELGERWRTAGTQLRFDELLPDLIGQAG